MSYREESQPDATAASQEGRAEEASNSEPASLGEILAPVREDFHRSGMTEDELAPLIEEARDEVWREKQRGKAAE